MCAALCCTLHAGVLHEWHIRANLVHRQRSVDLQPVVADPLCLEPYLDRNGVQWAFTLELRKVFPLPSPATALWLRGLVCAKVRSIPSLMVPLFPSWPSASAHHAPEAPSPLLLAIGCPRWRFVFFGGPRTALAVFSCLSSIARTFAWLRTMPMRKSRS